MINKSFRDYFAAFSFGLYFYFWLILIDLEIFIFLNSRPGSWLVYSSVFNLVMNVLLVSFCPLIIFYFISFLKNRLVKIIFLCFGSISYLFFYFSYLFLIFYYLRTRFIFDWPFFWLNRSEAFITLFKIFPSHSWFSFLFLACLVFLVLFGILKTILFDLKFKPKRIYFISLAVLFFSGFIILSLSPLDVNGFLAGFIKKNFFSDNKIENFYTGEYNNHIINCQLGGGLDPAGLQLDNLGDKIFFIHLESVSSFLVNERNTPNLFRYSKQGVFFPSFYSSSVQTIRNEESILCGLPPALKENLISGLSWGKIDSLSCLPRILEQLGYKTLFFKDDSLNFAHTGDFMSGIGFEEIHHEDIMHKNDPELPWGFREDIFFDRVLEYIKSHYANEKIFAYIALSATNHTPFEINDDRYKTLVPYPASENPKQKLANTTFIQDAYVGDFLDDLFLNYPENSSFFVFSDQAWPIGIHPNNIYNEQGFYDENFLTFLLFLPPKNRNDIYEFDKVVDARYSQMDILPTIFEILGANNSYFLGNSFAGDIFKADVLPKPDEENSILMIQPYAGGFLAFVDWPEKYVFSIYDRKIIRFDLAKDPLEQNSEILSDFENYYYLITDFFNHNK